MNKLKRFYDVCVQRLLRKPVYVIVDVDIDNALLTFTSRGSRAVFKRSLMEVSLDPALIARLDVTQACYVGLKVAEYVQYQAASLSSSQEKLASRLASGTPAARYVSFDRHGYVVYVDPATDTMATHLALDIAKDARLLRQFPPDIAYAIGLYVGKRLYTRPVLVAAGGNVVAMK